LRKLLKFGLAGIVGLLLAAALGMWGWSRYLHAEPAAEALAALASDATVQVEQGEDIVFRPVGMAPAMGVVVYPGAGCDIRGYAPVLRRLAAAGYLTVIVSMPLEFAIFGAERASAVMAAHPEVKRWAIVGHSIGGAIAGSYVARHPDAMAGLVLWDTYPASDLSRYPHPVWLIHRQRGDGTLASYLPARRGLFPPGSPWVPIRGGVHMYFGSFEHGGYKEDWAPEITRDAQHDQEVAGTLAALRAMSAAS
jgi:pimeloyl-ACP methyl ester carboxylesterase